MLFAALSLIAEEIPDPPITEPPARPMEVRVVHDAITDQVRAWAIVLDRGNRLVVSCEPARYDGIRVTFHSQRWLAHGNVITGHRPVVYRFDDAPPRRMLWDVNDRRGRLSSDRRVNHFISSLYDADQLVVRTRDIEHRKFDMTFRLIDVRPAMARLLDACGLDTTGLAPPEPA
jgi:hypothetical protein